MTPSMGLLFPHRRHVLLWHVHTHVPPTHTHSYPPHTNSKTNSKTDQRPTNPHGDSMDPIILTSHSESYGIHPKADRIPKRHDVWDSGEMRPGTASCAR